MIIPVCCYTCGKILSNKYNYYINESKRRNKDKEITFIDYNETIIKKKIEGEIMDELGLIRICCRKTMMTSINIVDQI